MLFLINCEEVVPILRLIKNAVIPLIQLAALAYLAISIAIDLYKKYIKKRSLPRYLILKKIIGILFIFLGPWLINVIISLIISSSGEDILVPAQRCWTVGSWCHTNSDLLYFIIGIILKLTIILSTLIYFSKKRKLFTIITILIVLITAVVFFISASYLVNNC